MSNRTRRGWVTTVFLVQVLLLAACGGGGSAGDSSGSAEPVTPATTRETPLALAASNAQAVTVAASQFGGITLAIGQLAVDWTGAIDAAGGVQVTSACANGGSLTLTLMDRDTDLRVSRGDQLAVSATDCYLKPLEDSFTGTLTIDFVAPAVGQQQAGTITFGAVFDVANTGTSTVRIGGSLRFDYSADRLARKVHVASSVGPLTVFASQPGESYTEVLTLVDATRTARRDTARAVTTLRLRVASDLLGGAVDVGTSMPWSAWFDSFPDAGEFTVSGAGGQVTRLRASAAGTASFDILLGNVILGQKPAADVITPYVWSGTGWYASSGNGLGYLTQPADAVGFKPLAQQPVNATVAPQPGPFTWAYSRPLSTGTLASAVFVPTSSAPGQISDGTPIPATVLIEGALVSVTPTAQLLPGGSYYLFLDNGAVAPIADFSGETLPRPVLSVNVALTITASAKINGTALLFGPGAMLALDATASTAPDGAIVATRWSQISGPTLAIAGADTPIATVSPTAVAGNGQAIVQVEVRNAAGDTARAQLTFPVVADAGQSLVMTYRRGSGATSVSISDPANGAPYVLYIPANNVIDLIAGPRLLASLPPGTAWMAGLEVAYGAGGTPGVNVVWNTPGNSCNSGPTGRLKVLDFAVGTAGTIDRVAINFEETCSGVITEGSIRFGTNLALRP